MKQTSAHSLSDQKRNCKHMAHHKAHDEQMFRPHAEHLTQIPLNIGRAPISCPLWNHHPSSHASAELVLAFSAFVQCSQVVRNSASHRAISNKSRISWTDRSFATNLNLLGGPPIFFGLFINSFFAKWSKGGSRHVPIGRNLTLTALPTCTPRTKAAVSFLQALIVDDGSFSSNCKRDP